MTGPDVPGTGTDPVPRTGASERPSPSPEDQKSAPEEQKSEIRHAVSGSPAPADDLPRGSTPAAADDPPGSGLEVGSAGVGSTVARLTDDDLAPAQRRRLVGRLAAQLGRRAGRLVVRPKTAVRWVADMLGEVVPHLPIRDLDTLRRHYGGLDGEALADRLVRNAALVTGGIGAAGGGITAVEWIAPPTLLTAPAVLAAETLAVVAVEIKLIGELHAVYRRPLPGTGLDRATALLHAWAGRRGVNPALPGRAIAVALSTATRKQLTERLARRFGRNLTTLGPLLTGAAVAAYLNRRATRALARDIRADLARPAIDPA